MKVKKGIKIAGITLGMIIVLLAVTPLLFKDKITALVKESINENVNAKVDFADVDISLLSGFPKAKVSLNEISVINRAPFEGDTLFYADKVSVKMGISELFKGSGMEISSFAVNKANVNVLVNSEGQANYDIAKESEETGETGAEEAEGEDFSFSVQHYEITDSRISYLDEEGKMQFVLEELNHSGSGDLSLNKSELETQTDALVSFVMDSTAYVKRNKVSLDAVLGIDLENNRYTFLDNTLLFNQLPLVFDGYVQINENNQEVDVTFNTPSSDFRNFLAVIPEAYASDIENVETTGNFEVKGKVNGIIDDTHIPAFDIKIRSDNASFKYPDLPKSVSDIRLATELVNKTGLAKDTYVEIEKLSFRIDQDVFNARARLNNVTENMHVNARVDGKLNLANLSQAYPFPMEEELSGILVADITTAFDMASIENKKYGNTKNSGTLDLTGFTYASEEMANPVSISKANVTFNPTKVNLNKFEAKTGQTDLNASGTINNLMGFMFNKENIEGNFNLSSNTFALNDFMVDDAEEGESIAEDKEGGEGEKSSGGAGEKIKIPSFLDCTVNASANTVIYDNLKLKNVKGILIIKDETATLKDLRSDVFNGQLAINGDVSTKEETPTFKMNMDIQNFDIAESFKGLDMLKALTPIAGILQGKLNTDLSLSGNLKDDLTPVLLSVTGNALAEVLTSGIDSKNSKLLSGLAGNLNFLDTDKLDLKDIKAALSFEDGKVNVKPFHIKYQDIDIEVAGSHGFDKTLGYTATFNVPAKYLGKEANNLLAQLNEQEQEEMTVPVKATIGGTYTNPSVSTDMKSAVAGLTQQLVAKQKDKLVGKGKDALGNLLGSGKNKDTTATDTTKTKKQEAVKEAAKDVLQGLFGKKKKDTTN
ncbi:AsmA-like C-terminal region-containing protein [Sinomicrobium weinanense]|uniref:AsmA family protein n=1 Tax=Sinomicrobium weinanense TaxID=2842200 RepID=A0A926JPI6_9FLAO|nr:AsmA-like C-terminal region-containing protein [Sinomicrobium weinanense]MBC9795016.1 AsmA family protein [Sinomicrobium weinanense]MBU3125123.1 AsmA family protein [Sinomicrobium weinanense]